MNDILLLLIVCLKWGGGVVGLGKRDVERMDCYEKGMIWCCFYILYAL